jgi:putative membrane protein
MDQQGRSESAVRIESMSRFIFTAPGWPKSILILVVLGLMIEGISWRLSPQFRFFGILCFIIPGLLALIATRPLITVIGRQMTWNRSALLAVSCTLFSSLITLIGLIVLRDFLALIFGIALGFIFGLRLLILVSIADYRMTRVVLPALIQSLAGYAGGLVIFAYPFTVLTPVLLILFGSGFAGLIWLIDRPLKRAFRIRGLEFLNAFIAHLTDGSRSMEDFFRGIGEEAFVPQVSIFFSRQGKKDLILTIPNVHPGPMGEIGGGNLPAILRDRFDEEVMVAHGCATHDFNLVSESEIDKLVIAVNKTRSSLRYSSEAGRSVRVCEGSVSLLYQRIGDTLLMVSTRSPEKTEDLDFCIGHAIISEGHRVTPHIGFIDAHNSIGDEIASIRPGTRTAHEYFTASCQAFDQWPRIKTSGLSIGYAHIPLPYGRLEGIGDIGLQVLICEVSGQKTAYILLDGKNMASGTRERLRDEALTLVDEAEIMTTDTHVVNTISGKNPVGFRVSPADLIPYIREGINSALKDLSPASAAGSSASCEGVIIFGSDSIAQLASIVNTILVYIIPISAGMLMMAVVLSVIAYMILS